MFNVARRCGRALFWSSDVPNVEIYTSPLCSFCTRAKALLNKKGVKYKEVNVMTHPGERKKMTERTGRTSVPQIFIDGKAIGGCDELFELDFDGDLNGMLGI